MGFLFSLTYNTMRVGIVASAVYATYSYGVWDSSSDRGRKLLADVKKSILPGAGMAQANMPSASDVKEELSTGWNYGVRRTFDVIHAAPEMVCDKVCKTIASE